MTDTTPREIDQDEIDRDLAILEGHTVLSAEAIDKEQLHAHRDFATEEANRLLVLKIFESDDITILFDHMRDDYKQHNPTVQDGKAGAIAFFTDMLQRFPNQKAYVKRVATFGDLVWVHAHLCDGTGPGTAMCDIFRIQDGMIAEHWDVLQPVPAEQVHSNTMF